MCFAGQICPTKSLKIRIKRTICVEVHKYILELLYIAREKNIKVPAIMLQKIFFLLEKEGKIDLGLGFKPDTFGAFSEKLHDAVYELIDAGLVEVSFEIIKNDKGEAIGYREIFSLSDDVKEVYLDKELVRFFERWLYTDKDELQEYVGRKYPEYTVQKTIRLLVER